MSPGTRAKLRTGFRVFYALFYLFGGINHFYNPAFYLHLMPTYIPAHALMVQLSGVAEIILGIALLVPRTVHLAGWGIIALLLAVSPVHVYMLQYPERFPEVPYAGLWFRIVLQLFFIWWAWLYTRPAPAAAPQPTQSSTK
jgi:uncharacterized membrane protein